MSEPYDLYPMNFEVGPDFDFDAFWAFGAMHGSQPLRLPLPPPSAASDGPDPDVDNAMTTNLGQDFYDTSYLQDSAAGLGNSRTQPSLTIDGPVREQEHLHTLPAQDAVSVSPAANAVEHSAGSTDGTTSLQVASGDSASRCEACGLAFNTQGGLEWHCLHDGCNGYRCKEDGCEMTFVRVDILRRHMLQHREDVIRHPCPHCRKYRGANGFKRSDHLRQHLRNYHMVDAESSFSKRKNYACRHSGCEMAVLGAFKAKAAYTKHLKKEHKESPFPCPAGDCERVGAKGFFRQRDLVKHHRREHGGEDPHWNESADKLLRDWGFEGELHYNWAAVQHQNLARNTAE